MKVYVYQHDRSEIGMTAPIIRRLIEKGCYAADWKEADIVIIPGDRRETIRFALDVFEHCPRKKIWHLGAGDMVDGVAGESHYDHLYRKLISFIATESGGMLLGLSVHALLPFNGSVVGPTMIDDLPNTEERPISEPYKLLCYNPLPWKPGVDDYCAWPEGNVYAMSPGNDGIHVGHEGEKRLPHMERPLFLRWLRHADEVWGNSSCLFYEAPLWHSDYKIHVIGARNQGRKIVRWDSVKYGCPSDNVIGLLLKEAKNDRNHSSKGWV